MTSTLSIEQSGPPAGDEAPCFALTELDWDTAFFGARMGVIAATEAAQHVAPAHLAAALRDLLEVAAHDGYAHLIFRAAADDSAAIWAAEGAGLRLVDVGIDSTFDLARQVIPEAPGAIAIRPHRADDVPVLAELAARAFTLSRFSADPFFTADQVMEFHRTWTRNLCSGLAQAVLVAEIDGQVAGFVSCARSAREARIPLIGVDGRFRGRGLGQALVNAALRWSHGAGCQVAHVKTQAHNYPALALYHRAGYVVTRSELTFSVMLYAAPHHSTEVLHD